MAVRGKISLEEWRESKAYKALTNRQKLACEGYIASDGDRRFAVRAGRNFKNVEVERVSAVNTFKNPRVMAALSEYYGDTVLDRFKSDLLKAIRNPKLSVARVQALKMFAAVNGIDVSVKVKKIKATDVHTKHFVGELVIQDGISYRVTRLDENGEIDTAEEIPNVR